jgi:Fur family ferric uptake transcriptional regulator
MRNREELHEKTRQKPTNCARNFQIAAPKEKFGHFPLLDIVKKLDKTVAMNTDSSNLLREKGVQVTVQRLAVMRVVNAQPHCTADEIAEAVRQEIGTISRQAVYDAVKLLVEKGIIRRIQPAGSPALFEDRVGDNHHHVICRKCGKTADVDCAVGEKPCLQAADCAGYQIDEAEVIYWGVCPTCLAAQTN